MDYKKFYFNAQCIKSGMALATSAALLLMALWYEANVEILLVLSVELKMLRDKVHNFKFSITKFSYS